MPDVFINYRTGDSHQAATTIKRALSERFGKERIYRASDSIPPGTPFDENLIHNVRRSGVLLALIGERWLTHPNLRKTEDWVRREIQEAFLCDIRVVPVLIGRKTERPTKDMLPGPLGRLADCQSLRYDHQNDEYDLKRIGDALAALVPELAAVDSAAPTESEPGTVHNTSRDNHGASVQAGTVNGDISHFTGTHGAVHIGPSSRTINQSGSGNYVEGTNNGGIRQYYAPTPHDEDEER